MQVVACPFCWRSRLCDMYVWGIKSFRALATRLKVRVIRGCTMHLAGLLSPHLLSVLTMTTVLLLASRLCCDNRPHRSCAPRCCELGSNAL